MKIRTKVKLDFIFQGTPIEHLLHTVCFSALHLAFEKAGKGPQSFYISKSVIKSARPILKTDITKFSAFTKMEVV